MFLCLAASLPFIGGCARGLCKCKSTGKPVLSGSMRQSMAHPENSPLAQRCHLRKARRSVVVFYCLALSIPGSSVRTAVGVLGYGETGFQSSPWVSHGQWPCVGESDRWESRLLLAKV